MKRILPSLLLLALHLSGTAPGQDPKPAEAEVPDALRVAAVRAYADLAHEGYRQSVTGAERLQKSIDAFLAEPSEARLAVARQTWIAARKAYSPTEVFRFYGGPIDSAKNGVELFVNAWPVDEAFIESVETVGGAPASGLVFDTKRVPVITPEVLQVLNQQGGEANIACGWHAIEFLLWGQDLRADGPGERPASDYHRGRGGAPGAPGTSGTPDTPDTPDTPGTPGAERRTQLLQASAELLVRHLRQVRDAWAPSEVKGESEKAETYRDTYRDTFLANPGQSLRHILTGICVLAGFELSGERLAVAYETRDQEDEHSCFSDTTHLDILGNIDGIRRVYDQCLAPLARAADPELPALLTAHLDASRDAADRIPVPFDRALNSPDEAARVPLLEAINALEFTAISFSAFANELGFAVPIQPGK